MVQYGEIRALNLIRRNSTWRCNKEKFEIFVWYGEILASGLNEEILPSGLNEEILDSGLNWEILASALKQRNSKKILN